MTINVLQYLENAAKLFPDKTALEDDRTKVTYNEYILQAKKIGSFLTQKCEGFTNRPIAVLIDRNVETVICFMGIVYSGNFYVPIDASMPRERIQLILDKLNPILIIDAKTQNAPEENTIAYETIVATGGVNEKRLQEIRRNFIDTDPLYAIFTSGSTGIPKGAVISHKSVIDLAEAFEIAFSLEETTIFGNQAPFDFDVSVKDIYNSLKVCGTIQILSKKLFKMPKLLIDYLYEKKVNTLIWAVSALRIVADFKTLDEAEYVPKISSIMFSGETMPVKTLNYWMAKMPGTRFVNLYGPTEITCNCTYYIIDKKYKDDEMLPIGKAFANSRVYLRGADGKFITETKVVGEICVAGTCLALGYWNDKEKTQDVFIQNPDIEAYYSKMYTSGDMGYYDDDGNMVFVSRKDYQIKHMGHRIELGEIEVALNAIPFITISCCLYDKQRERIVCFYQSATECKKEIVRELSKKLPKYMWPNVYEHYEELPLNKNGKIDRAALEEKLKQR